MPNTVRVRVLNVGQGDAIVGILPGGSRAFVVDVYDSDRVLDFLAAESISEAILFLSHSDRDHTAGASDFITGFQEMGRILGIFYNLDRLNARANSEYVKLTKLIGQFTHLERRRAPDLLYAEFNRNLNRIPSFSALFPTGSHMRVAHPERSDQSCLIGQDTNETAGVLMVESRSTDGESRRMLLAADVQLTGMSLLLSRESQESIRADVLKFPHHGAWPQDWPGINSVGVEKRTLKDLLWTVQPTAVILSTGFHNQHDHVRPEVFGLLEEYRRETSRLRTLKCTQFTPRCLKASALPGDGPLSDPHCAGDIEVRLRAGNGDEGVRVLTFPKDHEARIAEVHRAGCAQCGFLGETQFTPKLP